MVARVLFDDALVLCQPDYDEECASSALCPLPNPNLFFQTDAVISKNARQRDFGEMTSKRSHPENAFEKIRLGSFGAQKQCNNHNIINEQSTMESPLLLL